MLVFEVDRGDIRAAGSVKKAINDGFYLPWDDTRIKHAFSFGNGTIADFNVHAKNNRCYCVYIDAETMQEYNPARRV